MVGHLQNRSVSKALWSGFKCKCPNCGTGKLFGNFLKPVPECTACKQNFEGQRADDLPPYITITLVGHIIVGLNLAIERASDWPIWVHMALWPSLTVLLTLSLIQPIKGATIGYQWALKLHGFDEEGDAHKM